MKTLFLDASASYGAVGLMLDGEVIFNKNTGPARTHSETLLPIAVEALGEDGIRGVDLIACSVGPGSFTGVRIAVSLAKGLAAPHDIPCVGLSSLEVLAYPYADFDGTVCAMLDARRGNVYNALFEGGKRTRPDRLISLEELAVELRATEKPVMLTGDAALDAAGLFDKEKVHIGAGVPDGGAGAALGELIFNNLKKDYSARLLRPEYLRPSQAERERESKENG